MAKNFQESSSCVEKVLKIYTSLFGEGNGHIASVYGSLGHIYEQHENFELSLTNYET